MVENLEQYYEIVEEAIRILGVEPVGCRGKDPGQWNLRKGSARVWMDLWHIQHERRAYFQCMAPIMPVPTARREEFFQELLNINDKLFGVAFALYDGWAWLKAIREVDGMSVSEAVAIVRRIGYYADHYDDGLKVKYSLEPRSASQPAEDGPLNAPIHPSIPPDLA